MYGKYSSYRDSALHFLCSSEWGNDSFGDSNDYGAFIWRISNSLPEVHVLNTEINSVLEDWEDANPDCIYTREELRAQLVGHFLVSENSTGSVHVQEFNSEHAVTERFNAMQEHYNNWADSNDDNSTESE